MSHWHSVCADHVRPLLGKVGWWLSSQGCVCEECEQEADWLVALVEDGWDGRVTEGPMA